MLVKVKNGVYFMQFPNLAGFPELVHAVFTRRGGGSAAPYDSLNVSFGLGDEDARVRQNRELLARITANGEGLFAHQVHGTNVLSANTDGPRQGSRAPTGDALITRSHTQMLTIQVADCQAVLLYDPVQGVVANVHAGWRGSIHNIVGRTIARMERDYGCRPGHLVAGIGPSLGPCCAEFINYTREIPRPYWHHRVAENHFDFWAITGEQLQKAGVLPANVHTSEICTRCNPQAFFSYRRAKVTGRFAAVIGLRHVPPGPR